MSAKQGYVWDGSTWQALGTQVPSAPFSQKFGSDSVVVTTDPGTKTITFPSSSFTAAPLVFLQITSTGGGSLVVSAATSTTFTVTVKGVTSTTVTFNWYAVQPTAV
jgi:hypothetical protein